MPAPGDTNSRSEIRDEVCELTPNPVTSTVTSRSDGSALGTSGRAASAFEARISPMVAQGGGSRRDAVSTQVGRLADAHSYEGSDLQYPEASTKLDGGLGSGKGTEASWGRGWGVDGSSIGLRGEFGRVSWGVACAGGSDRAILNDRGLLRVATG